MSSRLLVWLAGLWGRLLPGFPVGITLTPGVCQGGKTGLVLGDFKFQFRSCILAHRTSA